LGCIRKKSDKVVGRGKRSLKGSVVSQELIQSILGRYTLPWEGTHGVPHWARVIENGSRLSEATGTRGMRINEGIDDRHGRRGSELARDLRGVAYIKACDLHAEGY